MKLKLVSWFMGLYMAIFFFIFFNHEGSHSQTPVNLPPSKVPQPSLSMGFLKEETKRKLQILWKK
jgi:hypothetical protein